jgi:hypothetical protein
MPSISWVQDQAQNVVGPFASVGAAASITAIVPDITITPYLLGVGSKFRATIYGKITTITSPGTYTFTVNWGGTGGTQLVSSGALTLVASATNIPFRLEYTIGVIAVANGLATMFAQGIFQTFTSVLATPAFALIPASAPASVASLDITTSKALNFSVTPSVTTTTLVSNLYTLESLAA